MQCYTYNLVYSSLVDIHRCSECQLTVGNDSIEKIILAFELFKSKQSPVIIPNYNLVRCIGCLKYGGVGFREIFFGEFVCHDCGCAIRINLLEDALVNVYRTKLIERIYHFNYPVFQTEKNKNG